MRLSISVCALSALAFLPSPGHAADAASQPADNVFQPASASGWIVTLTGNAGAASKWSGSKDAAFSGYPSVSFRRPGATRKFSSPDDAVSYALYDSARFDAGPMVRYRAGRYDGSDAALRGIHNARWSLEGGAYATYWILPETLRARAEIRRGFRNDDGFVGTVGFDWINCFGPVTVAVGPRLSAADGNYNRTLYGVTQADALANPRVTPYRPAGGMRSAGLFASATYQFTPNWAATAYAGYDRLVGEAAKSPIVRNIGSKNQYSVGGSLSWSFNWAGL